VVDQFAADENGDPGRRIPILPFSNRLLPDRFANLLHCFAVPNRMLSLRNLCVLVLPEWTK
jgi:hypothetical protein